MWKIFKRHGCQPTLIPKPSRLRRRERNVTARAAIDIGKATEETVNVNKTNPVPVEETESAENTESKQNSLDQLRFLLPLYLEKLMRLLNYNILLLT